MSDNGMPTKWELENREDPRAVKVIKDMQKQLDIIRTALARAEAGNHVMRNNLIWCRAVAESLYKDEYSKDCIRNQYVGIMNHADTALSSSSGTKLLEKMEVLEKVAKISRVYLLHINACECSLCKAFKALDALQSKDTL